MWIEDFDRMQELDELYLQEYNLQIEEEWRQWLDEQEKRLPAKIKTISKKKHNETEFNSFSF